MPTSSTAMSTASAAKCRNASAVIVSKNWNDREAARPNQSRRGFIDPEIQRGKRIVGNLRFRIKSVLPAPCACALAPNIRTRSFTRARCGEVYNPTL